MTSPFQYFFHWIKIYRNLKKFLKVLKTYVHYLRHRFINQKLNVKTGAHNFTKIKSTDAWKKKKNVFFSYFILVIPNFSYKDFFRKCSMFRRSIPLTVNLIALHLNYCIESFYT